MTALAKTENAEVKAMAHAAHTFSRLSVRNLKEAERFPRYSHMLLPEARRLRKQANDYLQWARQTKAWSRAQALAELAELDAELI